jgi:hypothetical protein
MKSKSATVTAAATATTPTTSAKRVVTEDLGKIFEMAICLLYEIPYVGKYKYSLDEATALMNRIRGLRSVFDHHLTHTAKNGYQYDFEGSEDTSLKLSAKTTKKDGKVCPQVIGQPSKKKFCSYFDLPADITLDEIKTHIETNTASILETYFNHTFDCPVIYYNEKKSKLLFIRNNSNIDWEEYKERIEFSHKLKNKIWNESTTISIDGVTIGEFQVHNHRDCIKFRWCFEKLLDRFSENFHIIDIPML